MGTVGQFSGFVSLFKIKSLIHDWPRDDSVKAKRIQALDALNQRTTNAPTILLSLATT